MGGRAAYTLATALFIGSAGLLGFFALLFLLIPKAAIFPILIFIGIEITAQSFHVTPKRHYAAVAVACLPAIAKLVVLGATPYVAELGFNITKPENAQKWLYLNVLAGGFIFTSVIWASATAKMIDRRYKSAGVYFLVAAGCTLFGVMHSPLAGDRMFLPTDLLADGKFSAEQFAAVRDFAIAYVVMAGLMFGLAAMLPDEKPIDTDQQYEELAA